MDSALLYGGLLNEEAGQSYLELGNLIFSVGQEIWNYYNNKYYEPKNNSQPHCGGCLCKYPTLVSFLNEDEEQNQHPDNHVDLQLASETNDKKNIDSTQLDCQFVIEELEKLKESEFSGTQLKKINDEYNSQFKKFAEESEILIKEERELLLQKL